MNKKLHSKLVASANSVNHPKRVHELCISSHHFNSSLEISFPFPEHSGIIENPLTSLHNGSAFYYYVRGPLSAFLESTFLSAYVKDSQGDFLLLSSGTTIDSTDTIALCKGILHMAVNKETYETLGLTGKSSKLTPGQRFNISIDTRAKSFVPGRNLYDRVHQSLTERCGEMDYLCSFYKGGICQPIEFPPTCRWYKLRISEERKLLEDFPIPSMNPNPIKSTEVPEDRESKRPRWEEQGCSLKPEFLSSLFEWIGAASCGVLGYKLDKEMLDACTVSNGRIHSVRWTGLVAPNQVSSCFHSVCEFLKTSAAPFAVLSAWGFADAPVSWGGAEHGFLEGGENDYAFIIFPSGNYVLFRASGKYDLML